MVGGRVYPSPSRWWGLWDKSTYSAFSSIGKWTEPLVLFPVAPPSIYFLSVLLVAACVLLFNVDIKGAVWFGG